MTNLNRHLVFAAFAAFGLLYMAVCLADSRAELNVAAADALNRLSLIHI